jgi:hypothetical protein
MDRAEERAGPEDVGDQALMRGLVTAFPLVRLGCPCLRSCVDHVIGHVDSSGVPLAVVPPSLLHDYVLLGDPFSWVATQESAGGPQPKYMEMLDISAHWG